MHDTAPDCPDSEVIAAWIDDRLPSPQRTTVSHHLSTCPKCAELVSVVIDTLSNVHVSSEPFHSFRRTFGDTECEIAVEQTDAGGAGRFVAWAMVVREDGRLDALYDQQGALLRAYGDAPSDVLPAIHAHLAARFGLEQPRRS